MAPTRLPGPAGAPPPPSPLHPAPPAAPGAPARKTATAPVTPGTNTSKQRKYGYVGAFDTAKIESGFNTKFKGVAKYDARSVPHLEVLLGFIENDTAMTDIRWAAYMLATAFWETSHTEKAVVPKVVKGKPVVDKGGKVVTRTINIWINMSPITELGGGAGRRYHRPVKVFNMPTGEVQVTEYDGDQWIIDAKGKAKAVAGTKKDPRKKVDLGAPANAAATARYTAATGDEKLFLGRGYVQLTWWEHYATAGVDLNKGVTFFLDDPERALEPANAYALMSLGMRTGAGFANGKKFDDYFSGNQRDYTAARHMVNGTDNAAAIATLAELFEDVLYDARKQP